MAAILADETQKQKEKWVNLLCNRMPAVGQKRQEGSQENSEDDNEKKRKGMTVFKLNWSLLCKYKKKMMTREKLENELKKKKDEIRAKKRQRKKERTTKVRNNLIKRIV